MARAASPEITPTKHSGLSHSQLTEVIDYIRDQERHHARRSFRDEYLRFLKKYEIEHDEKYIFKPLD